MDAAAQYELEHIKTELQNIVRELNNIAYGVRNDFSGIGNDRCADSISRTAAHYTAVRNKLNSIDTSAVTEEFVAAQRDKERQLASASTREQQAKTALQDENKQTVNQSSSKSKLDNWWDNLFGKWGR